MHAKLVAAIAILPKLIFSSPLLKPPGQTLSWPRRKRLAGVRVPGYFSDRCVITGWTFEMADADGRCDASACLRPTPGRVKKPRRLRSPMPGDPRLTLVFGGQNVDGRVKPGHDERG